MNNNLDINVTISKPTSLVSDPDLVYKTVLQVKFAELK